MQGRDYPAKGSLQAWCQAVAHAAVGPWHPDHTVSMQLPDSSAQPKHSTHGIGLLSCHLWSVAAYCIVCWASEGPQDINYILKLID